MRDYHVATERHTTALIVTCPVCCRESRLSVAKRNAARFVGEWCDGGIGARHRIVQMLGPAGEPNR